MRTSTYLVTTLTNLKRNDLTRHDLLFVDDLSPWIANFEEKCQNFLAETFIIQAGIAVKIVVWSLGFSSSENFLVAEGWASHF